MGRFSGKVALVTGAASGVGRATVRQMVKDGANVSGIDINQEGLEALSEEIGEQFHHIACDISDREAAQNAVEESVVHFGKLDIVANVAGVVRSHHATDVDEQTW